MAQGAEYTGEPAVTDGNLITGRGPGCAIRFAPEILRKLRVKKLPRRSKPGF